MKNQTVTACYDHGATCPFFTFNAEKYHSVKPAPAECGAVGTGKMLWNVLFDHAKPLVIEPPPECPLRKEPITVTLFPKAASRGNRKD